MTQNSPLAFSACIAYSAPYITSTWLVAPMGLIQGVYAKYYGLSLTSIAAVILFARIFDAMTDPMIGYCSDRHYQRVRSRKPLIFIGGILCLLSGYFLFSPTDLTTLKASSEVSVIYFLGWFVVFFLAWTLFEIPHLAWANELAYSAQDKTRIFSVRAIAYYLGALSFYAIPLLPIFESDEITPETLRFSVISAGVLMVVFLCLCLKYTPDNFSTFHRKKKNGIAGNVNLQYESATKNRSISKKEIIFFLKTLLKNKPLRIFIVAFIFSGLGAGMFFGVFFIYVDSYLVMGDSYAKTTMMGLLAAIISIPVWHFIATRMGKKIAWLFSMVLIMISFGYISTFVPGGTHFYELVVAVTLLNVGVGCTWSIAPAMLAEIVDYSTWKYSAEKTATYFSLYAFMNKFSTALATSLGIAIVGWSGLDITVPQSESGVWDLVMVWIPLIFCSAALICIALSPLNTRRHDVIRRRLDLKASRPQPVKNSCKNLNIATDISSCATHSETLIGVK